MKFKLYWSKKLLSGSYNIFLHYNTIGSLKQRYFSQSAKGIMNGKSYSFKTTGFLHKRISIINHNSNEIVGNISYSNRMNTARIVVRSTTWHWKYENRIISRWCIFNSEGGSIKYAGSSTSGKIESETDDDLLVLTGLYLTNYYRQMIILFLLLAFIPILYRHLSK